jgi:protein phosphatase
MPPGRILAIPSPSLVVMVGAAGSGKSSFCARNFLPTQVVSSDACRAMLADDPGDQKVSAAAFSLAYGITEERLRLRRLTVLDATNVESGARRNLLRIAARHHLPSVAIILALPTAVCRRQNGGRDGRRVGARVIARQADRLRADLPALRAEGFSGLHILRTAREAATARVRETPLACDRSNDPGPFDIIGDVHGCAGELRTLLARLGYRRPTARVAFRHAGGRRAVLLGDLVDRGPRIVEAARIAMRMVEAGSALCVIGNHDADLLHCLREGTDPESLGTDRSIRQIGALPTATRRRFVQRFGEFVASLPDHLVLDGGRLVVAHAGLRQDLIGRQSDEVRRLALHGATTGAIDRYGLAVRTRWAATYRGSALVVYGHTPVPAPEWLNNTVNIDTGCVYGGTLTALRYPGLEFVSVPSGRVYYRSRRSIPSRIGVRAETRATPNA